MTSLFVKSQTEGEGKTILLMQPKVSLCINPRKAQEQQKPPRAALWCQPCTGWCPIPALSDASCEWSNPSPAKVNETLPAPSHVYSIWLSTQPTSTHFAFSILSFPVTGDVNLLLFMSQSITAWDVQGPQHGQVSWELDFRISWCFAIYAREHSKESKPYVIPPAEPGIQNPSL